MKLKFFAFLLLSSFALAQGIGARYENVVLSKDAQGFVKPLTTAVITVCKEPATGTTSICSPPATIYSDASLSTQQNNPFNVDSAGGFSFFVAPGQYRIQISAANTITTMANVSVSNTTTPLGLYRPVTFGTAMSFDASLGGIFAVTLTGDVTSSTIANSVAGMVIGFQVCQDATGGRAFAWPGSFVSPPSVGTTANSCTTAQFWYDGASWRAISGGGGSGGGGTGIVIVSSNAGLPDVTNGNFYIAAGFGGPTMARAFVGDGSGLSYFFSKRTGGTTTDLFGFKDDGTFSLFSTGNGIWDMSSVNAGTAGPANYVRYQGCSNKACVSENNGTPVNILRPQQFYGFCAGVFTASSTIVIPPFGTTTANSCSSTTNTNELPIDFAGTLRTLRVKAANAGVNAASGVVTVYKNGSATSVTCTVGTGTTCNDLVNTVTWAAGDTVGVRVGTFAGETLSSMRVSFLVGP